jgi:osmotically-inducible protein OsmY
MTEAAEAELHMSEPREPEHYAGERLREALAADPRVSDLSVQVHIVAGNVFVTGSVPTQERLDAVSEIASRVLPDHVVHNDLSLITLSEAPAVEHL